MEKKENNLVTTVSGLLVEEKDCRKINDEYYKIGDINVKNSGDCYFIKNKYRRVKTKFIVYDYTLKKYVLKGDFKKSPNYVEKGVVGFEEDNSTPIFGAFSSNINIDLLPLIEIKEDGISNSYVCINENIFNDCISYKEHLRKNMFVPRNKYDAISYSQKIECDLNIKNSLPYDSKGLMSDLTKIYNDYYIWDDTKSLFKQPNLTKGLSFGVEFETTEGYIPDNICKRLGLMALRDGSIKGFEYVTVPLEGNKGIHTLYDITKELKKRTEYDINCSLHYHIGNIPRTEEFFLALFKTLFCIQEDMYKLFPYYKYRNCGVKRKPYTKPLPLETMLQLDRVITPDKVKENFKKLFSFLSMGYRYEDYNNDLSYVKSHPSDPQGNSKWNIKTRYHWVNLIPLLFGNKQTVEFRIHTATLDSQKILNYLLICTNIVNFVKENIKNILEDKSSLILRKIARDSKTKFNKPLNNLNAELLNYIDLRDHAMLHGLKRGELNVDEDTILTSYSKYFCWETFLESNNEKKEKEKEIADYVNNYIDNNYHNFDFNGGNVEIEIDNL